ATSVRPEPGSNSPIKFVSGSKLANHFMIDSSTLSLFSFQRAFCFYRPEATFLIYHIPTQEIKWFFNFLRRQFFR
ncbi:hypothetical protein, partial [Brevibacillus choshinensis]|uniref:hypothetical protein n=1 Tax=Brevibacillus choshinensis TaxID=54911 RepID=UPI002E1CDA2A|nr:hypothetical protein [Brevibacillus choshinensis]